MKEKSILDLDDLKVMTDFSCPHCKSYIQLSFKSFSEVYTVMPQPNFNYSYFRYCPECKKPIRIVVDVNINIKEMFDRETKNTAEKEA